MTVEISPSASQNVSIAKKAPEAVTEPPTTISDLPVEILLSIFILNARHNFHYVHSPSRTTRHTSQVCKRWRHITLNSPTLWAQSIDFKDPLVWIKKVTTRCGTLPIDMMIPSVTNSLMKSCADEYLHRTSPRPVDLVRRWDLPICYDAKILSPWFFNLPGCRNVVLKIPAMIWTSFGLDKMDMAHLESLTVVDTGLIILEPMLLMLWNSEAFVGKTPWNMRSLTLSGCFTAFDAHAFSYLSELTVHHVPSGISLSPSEWLDVLSNMPALKHLELVNTTLTPAYYNLDEPEELSYSKLSVSLPQLEVLHLDAPLRHCSHIFEHLKLPPSCNIIIAAGGLSSIDTSFHLLVAEIEQHFERSSSEESISLTGRPRSLLAAVTPSSCVINLKGPNNPQDSQNSVGSLSFSIRWNSPNSHAVAHIPIDPLDVFSALTSAIRKPCANVTDLNLVVAITIDDKERHHAVLDAFLSSFHRLESIEQISSSTLQFLLPFFNSRTDRTKTFGELLPRLRAISFVDVNFANYELGELSLLGILLSFVRFRLPTAEYEDKSSSGLDAGSVEKTPITDMRFHFCRAIREKAVKNFESFGVLILRDGMSFGYLDTGIDGGKEEK
ncbi:hypothetical protein BYT27DRAFT_7205599 [Phlegmacium glaucopus]|nr:hypothetical protein BYT27DRAFT_7205599 [Phlegmacium glaucopus]